MTLRLLHPPSCRLPARSERSRSWTWPARFKKLLHVDPHSFRNRMKKHEAWTGSLTALKARKSPNAHPGVVSEALLGELGRPAEIPQVLGNTPEYVHVPHAPSRRLLAILFQAMRCLFFVA